MKLEQLRQLSTIERCGTLSAAAQELHLTQPSLSRSMQALEAELGQPLFSRTRNRAVLNDAGRLAVEHARHILAEEQRMRDAFDDLAKRQRTVRLASVAPAPTWRLGSIAAERLAGTILEPDLVDDDEALRRLMNGECDLAVTRRPLQLPVLACRPFMTEDLYLSVPAGHRLAKRSLVTFAELDGEPFLVFEQIGVWMEVCRQMLPHSQIVVQKDRVVFLQLVRVTDLCCFTTQVPENDVPADNRARIPIADPAAHATFYLCRRTDAPERARAIWDAAAAETLQA